MRSEFEKYVIEKYPKRSPKILTQILTDIDGTEFYAVQGVNDIWESWQHQQTKVDELQKRLDAVVIEIEKLHLSGVIGFGTVKKLEQALKGDEE